MILYQLPSQHREKNGQIVKGVDANYVEYELIRPNALKHRLRRQKEAAASGQDSIIANEHFRIFDLAHCYPDFIPLTPADESHHDDIDTPTPPKKPRCA
ncbi:MAG: hypothetical protein HOI53_09985 [Francisellaceae bacterium]|jgi:hypothetical protein|nr:hypothetical protein [Francisellaceae bacterium]MBT6208344.1 hypothetical protein [Francisellaceae bacterium]MBT6539487.1 hypothetical protein [Francisellaceae bacterium]